MLFDGLLSRVICKLIMRMFMENGGMVLVIYRNMVNVMMKIVCCLVVVNLGLELRK